MQLGRMVDLDALRGHGLRVLHEAMYGAGAGLIARALSGGIDHGRGAARRAQPRVRRHAPRADRPLHARGDGAHEVGRSSTSASPTTATPTASASSTRRGRYINQLQVMALFAMYLLEKRGLRGDIVRSITTSGMLDALGERFGVTVHEMPVGFKYIGTKMMETDAHPRRRGVRRLRVPRSHPRARRHPFRA